MQHENPYNGIKKEIKIDDNSLSYYSLPDLNDPRTCGYFRNFEFKVLTNF